MAKATTIESSSSSDESSDEEPSKPNQINKINSSQIKIKSNKIIPSSDSDSDSSTSSFVKQKKLVKKTNELLINKKIKTEPISSTEVTKPAKPTVEDTISKSIENEKNIGDEILPTPIKNNFDNSNSNNDGYNDGYSYNSGYYNSDYYSGYKGKNYDPNYRRNNHTGKF